MRVSIQEREAVRHTLGNLSLLTPARNPQIGKLGFDKKRERLRDSLFKTELRDSFRAGVERSGDEPTCNSIITIGMLALAGRVATKRSARAN